MMSPKDILTQNILPYWLALKDPIHGGFFGAVHGDETIDPAAPRGVILYARILWAFSAAYRALQIPEYLEAANCAKTYIEAHMLTDDLPVDAQAYILYAYAEYGRATGCDTIPFQYSFSLSAPMETLMHVMEAYTNLCQLAPSAPNMTFLKTLVERFAALDTPPEDFNAGHCIECAWLLDDAATLVGIQVDKTVQMLAKAAEQHINSDGTLDDREWWKQAEAVIGYDHLYRRFGDREARNKAKRFWEIICTRYVDQTHGEWYWAIMPDGTPDRTRDKVSIWKCPYHNTRVCIYLMNNSQSISS